MVRLVTLGLGVTTTVALSVNTILQPLKFILVNTIFVSTVIPITVIVAFPTPSNTNVAATPPFIVYVIVEFAVPTTLKTAS